MYHLRWEKECLGIKNVTVLGLSEFNRLREKSLSENIWMPVSIIYELEPWGVNYEPRLFRVKNGNRVHITHRSLNSVTEIKLKISQEVQRKKQISLWYLRIKIDQSFTKSQLIKSGFCKSFIFDRTSNGGGIHAYVWKLLKTS